MISTLETDVLTSNAKPCQPENCSDKVGAVHSYCIANNYSNELNFAASCEAKLDLGKQI